MLENKPVRTTPQRESAPDFSTREVDNLYRNTPLLLSSSILIFLIDQYKNLLLILPERFGIA